ncbi:MAG: hypothetical protein KF724_09855 [Phycisphaeraceae bacterium]|nr:hypothetical protein [Phycisphaeraceae bacterium]
MGQVALGLRSLAFRVATFVALAALFAWMVGGTLFPAAHRVNLPSWEFGGSRWNWRVTGSSTQSGPTAWTLFERINDRPVERRFDLAGTWREVRGPAFDGEAMVLAILVEPGARDRPPEWWSLRIDASPAPERRVERSRLPEAPMASGSTPLSTETREP